MKKSLLLVILILSSYFVAAQNNDDYIELAREILKTEKKAAIAGELDIFLEDPFQFFLDSQLLVQL